MEEPPAQRDAPHAKPRAVPAWLPWVGMVALIAAAYQPVWHAGFIWDDDVHLTENACIVGPGSFWDIWTSSHARICPLVISSFWVQHALWGLNPLPYHLVNVAMHAGCALVLWRVLRAMKVQGAWLGAALWALHPVQVESVAWITELKNTQSGLFFALTVMYFVRWLGGGPEQRGGRGNCLLMVLFALLAMASKSSTVVLPVILALCAWWVERRWNWRMLWHLAPVVLLALVFSALSLWTQDLEGANEAEWRRGMAERVATAGGVVWFYLGKLIWPSPLIFIYPRWSMDTAKVVTWLPILLAVVGLVFLWWRRDGKLRAVFMAAMCFVVALFPVLGLIDHYFLRYSFVGDHFQYLASMAPLALAGAGLATLPRWLKGARAWACTVPAALLLVLLGALVWRRVPVYQSSLTLWEDTVSRNPGTWMAWNNLGAELLARSDATGAVIACQRSLELHPENPKSRANLGAALLKTGRRDEAIRELREAIRLAPDHIDAHNNLAVVLLESGQLDEAIASCRRVIALREDSPEAWTNLGNALLLQGRAEEAIQAWKDALQAGPHYADVLINLSVVLVETKRAEEAIAYSERAVALRPNDSEAHNVLAAALRDAGRMPEAIEHFRSSITLRPGNGSAHNNLANALRQSGRFAEAMVHHERAAELLPDSVPVLNNLAWALATCPETGLRNGARAVELSQRALKLVGGENASLMRTLAAGQAAGGDYDRAQETARRALFRVTVGEDALAEALRRELALYEARRPVVEGAMVTPAAR